MPMFHATLSHLVNSAATPQAPYPNNLQEIASLAKATNAFADISRWPGYEQSPLVRLEQLAGQIDVAAIYYKDESQRFGLKSFKALGGAYAVAQQLLAQIHQQCGAEASVGDLLARSISVHRAKYRH